MNNGNSNPFADLNANFDQGRLQQFTNPQPAQNTNNGSFLTHLLPSLGGIGGGAAGAAIGTALLPGVGTLAGALLGGALGGGAGKVVENKQEGQGTWNGVAGQALENGVLSAGPLRLLKGAGVLAKAAPEVATGGKTLADVLANVGEQATAPTAASKVGAAIANKGAQMEARAGGFGIGEAAGGSSPLGFYDSAQIAKNLANEGVSAGSPEARLKQVEDLMNQKGSQIDQNLANANKALSTSDKQNIADSFMKSIEQQPGVDQATRDNAQNLTNNFMNQVNNVQDLVNFRRGLDNQVINFNQNPDAALAAKQLAARTFRGNLSDATNNLAPGIADLNKSYSSLANARDFLINGAKAVSNQSEHAGGSIVGRLLTNDTAQGAKSIAGKGLQKLAPGATASNPFSPASIAGRVLPAGVLGAVGNQGLSSGGAVNNADTMNNPNSTMMPQNINDAINSNLAQSNYLSSSNSPYTEQGLMYDISRDPKNAPKYLAMYNSLDKIFNPSGSNSLTTNQKNEVVSQNKALESLQAYANNLQSAGGGEGPIKGAIDASVLGNYTNPAARGMDAQRIDVASAIAGALNPRGTVSPVAARMIAEAMPTIHDTPKVVQAKLNNLVSQIQSGAYSAQTPVTDLVNNPQANQMTDLAGVLQTLGG